MMLAIISGGILGALLAFGIWKANNSLKNNKEAASTQNPSATNNSEISTPTSPPRLSIASPTNYIVSTQNTVTVSGLSTARSSVIISSENKDYLTQASETGAFEAEVELIGGLNEIKVFSFDADKKIDETSLNVAYSTEFARYILTTEELEEAQGSGDEEESIRNKVQEKLASKLSSPKFYIGSITDISSTSVQIKSIEGEIKLLNVTDNNVTFVKSTGKSPQNVEFKDLAIGDFVIALVFVNETEVLDAKRILITPTVTKSTRNAIIADISKLSSKFLTLGEKIVVNLTKGTNYFEISQDKPTKLGLSDIEIGNKVIVSGPVEDSEYEARLVVKIGSTSSPTPTPTPIEDNE